ncbi:MAG: transporter ATP-binding protein [Paenibacillaceae bacterium]|nr:transporter ATP-binding protein [Paenibacillaceae bacterium]
MQKSFTLQQEKLSIIHVPEWSVTQGEKLALLGASGSGKSTILHLLSGVMKPDSGDAVVCGYPLHSMGESERDRFRAENIGYIMQDFHLIGSLTAAQNVELVLDRRGQPASLRRKLIGEWFARVGLDDRMHHLPRQLSRGQQQRVAIVRALINSPRLVLADEPTGSLDYETAGAVMKLLLELCREKQLTLLTVTHDLELARLFPASVQIGKLNAVMGHARQSLHSDRETAGTVAHKTGFTAQQADQGAHGFSPHGKGGVDV